MDSADRGSAAPALPASLVPLGARTNPPALAGERLEKRFAKGGWALRGLSLRVEHGEFFGLLGPHGAGKTTALRILATLLKADTGRASVLGYDVRTAAHEIRRRTGYVPQRPVLDSRLTGRENVVLMGRLYGLGRQVAEERTTELLAQLGLLPIAGRQVKSYPHEARKLTALACGLVHRPRLLLLDDPTGGLPAHDRATVWRYLRLTNLADGITVLLATSSLEEAEGLCQRVALIDGGRIVTEGTPAALKAQVVGATATVRLLDQAQLGEVAPLLERLSGVRAVRLQGERLELEVAGVGMVPLLVRYLEEHEIAVREITLSRSSLDEVFFRHTGRKISDIHELPAPGTRVSGRR